LQPVCLVRFDIAVIQALQAGTSSLESLGAMPEIR
jgi:hypothetical protein